MYEEFKAISSRLDKVSLEIEMEIYVYWNGLLSA